MSEEIIKILDDLGERLGIAVDWTSQNILPYLQDLMSRFISLRNTQAIIWIIISSILILIMATIIVKMIKKLKKLDKNTYSYDDKVSGYILIWFVLGIIILGFLIALLCNIFGLIQNIYTPELTIIEYLTSRMGVI